MKLRAENHVELSVANLRALLADVDAQIAAGKRVDTAIYRQTADGESVMVSVVADEDHYTPEALERRRSPYLPPEAWAGI